MDGVLADRKPEGIRRWCDSQTNRGVGARIPTFRIWKLLWLSASAWQRHRALPGKHVLRSVVATPSKVRYARLFHTIHKDVTAKNIVGEDPSGFAAPEAKVAVRRHIHM